MKRISAISLVLANLVVALIVLSEQWGYYAVVLIYWLEAMIIGLYALGRLTVVCWFGEPFGRWVGMANGASRFILSLVASGFFIAKFGGFALGTGFLVTMIPGFLSENPDLAGGEIMDALGAVGAGVGFAATLLLVSHGISFAVNFIGKGEYKQRNLIAVLFEPYLRMVLVVAVLVAGMIGAALLPSLSHGTAFAIAVILLKTVVDLVSHGIDHRKRASGDAASTVPLQAAETP